MSITLARLACDEITARRLIDVLADSLDPDDCACAAFEADGGQWGVEIFFRTPPDKKAVGALVASAAGDKAAAALIFETLAAADWVAASLTNLTPVKAGRFIVHGAHDRTRVPANRIGIEIEAALAFGTGHHGTTRGCLLALDGLTRRGRMRNVLDVGTGSGVLAIAAARSMRCRVTAVDIDAQAVAAARGNARRNRAAGDIAFARGNGPGIRFVRARAPYDLILANILLAPLKRMAPPLSALAARGGYVVLSGLLTRDANAALASYRAQRLRLERRIPLEGWVTLVLRRC
jgi:ribosomal protein L11 methyltransferase